MLELLKDGWSPKMRALNFWNSLLVSMYFSMFFFMTLSSFDSRLVLWGRLWSPGDISAIWWSESEASCDSAWSAEVLLISIEFELEQSPVKEMRGLNKWWDNEGLNVWVKKFHLIRTYFTVSSVTSVYHFSLSQISLSALQYSSQKGRAFF